MDYRNLTSEPSKHLRELTTYVAATDHQKSFGKVCYVQ